MNEQEILNFKNSLVSMSVEELKEKKLEIDDKITKMILDSDLIVKAAIISALLEEKEDNK